MLESVWTSHLRASAAEIATRGGLISPDDAAHVLAEDADADELHTADEQHPRDHGAVPDRERDATDLQAGVRPAGEERASSREAPHHGPRAS